MTIVIAGSHVDDRVVVDGTTTAVPPGTAMQPVLRIDGGSWLPAHHVVATDDDGRFTWSRKLAKGKTIEIYVAEADIHSNTIVLAGRRAH